MSFLTVQNVLGQIAGPCGTTITVTNASNPTATDGKIVVTPTLTNKNYYINLGIVGSEMYGEMLKTTAASKLVLTGLVAGTYNVRVYREDTTSLNPCGDITQSVTVGAGTYATCVGTEIGGNIFHDANANGLREAGEGGAGGITVKAYNSAGTLVGTQTSTTTGVFKFTGLTVAQPYRLEYSWADGYLQSGAIGTSSGTSVQFVTAGTCTANFGINYPANYCQTANPYVVTPCYVNGSPQAAAVAPLDVMVTFPYKAASNDLGVPGQNIAPTHVATASQIGATWGVAYQKTTKYAFASAVLRRFAGFGPLGTGGIYKVNMATPTAPVTSNWLDVKTIGINTGNDTRNATAANTLSIAPGSPAWDAEAFNQIGKIGIGGIDFNDRGDTLWFMNLADKKLYGLKNVNPSVTPTAANIIGGYTVALPAGYSYITNANDFRPWAVKYYKGLVYVGAVCSGESTPWSSFNLRGYVLSFNPANPGAGFSYVTDFPLNYTRYGYGYGAPAAFTFQTWLTNATAQYSVPQPIVSDLEFDLDGSMIVALADRGGLQGGNQNYYADPTATNTTLLEGNTMGDILRFCKTGSTYIQSGVASCPNPVENLYTIPEYYWGDVGPFTNITNHFNESGAGSLAFLAGSGTVLETAQDAYGWLSGGTIAFSNTSGGDLWRYTVFDPTVPGSSGKATGLGDIEPLCDPAPIEIGNRVWLDNDRDGIQDAAELSISNITLQLLQGTTLVATTTTNASGNYKFTNLLPNTAYQIKLDLSQTNVAARPLSNANVGTNDLIDSDMTATGNVGIINLTTGNYGENNHSYDIALVPTCSFNAFIAGDTVICAGNTTTLTASCPSGTCSYLWSNGATTQNITVNPASTTNYSVIVTKLGTANAISNGSFESGNTGFTTDYNYQACGNSSTIIANGQYGIGVNNYQCYAYWGTLPAQQGNNFMYVDVIPPVLAGTTPARTRIWEQNVSVLPNTCYTFSSWQRFAVNAIGQDRIPKVEYFVDNISIGTSQYVTNSWVQTVYTAITGPTQTSVNLKIYAIAELNGASNSTDGNDLAIDNLEFRIPNQTSTNTITVVVTAPQTVTVTATGGTSICTGGNTTLTANVVGSVGANIYQWQSSPNGSTWTNIAGATASTYTTPSLTTNMQYRVVASKQGAICSAVTSNPTTVTVAPLPSVSIVTNAPIVCTNGAILTATPTGGAGACNIQWQSSPDGTTWTNISGATSNTYNPTTVGTTHYRAQMTCTGNGCCN